jgi:hypothetical protein
MTDMSDPSHPRVHIRGIRLSGWRAVAAIVVGLAVLVAVVAFLALSFLFIVLPTAILGTVAYYLLPRPASSTAEISKAAEWTRNAAIIDGTYKVTNDATEEPRNDHK